MRILHTSDWHVGKTLARRSRLDEAREALGRVVEIAREEDVDAVLVCGDVYDHLAPSAEAEQVVYDALLAFERGGVPVVLIPGNHDHAARWTAVAPLLERCAVYVVPEVRRPDRGGIVELRSRDGSETLQVASLPWVSERRLVPARELMGLAERPYQSYAEEMARLLAALCEPLDPGACTVLAAHAFVSGSRIGEGQRTLTVGQLYAITPQAIPSVQYAAFGHVHRPQRIPGAAVPARYSGSLLQLDFGESDQEKSVTVVDLEPGKPARPREVPLRAGRSLLEVHGTLEELEAHRETAEDAFLRVTLVCERPQPGMAEQVREILPHALEVRLDYPREEAETRRTAIRTLAPREQFARYLRERHAQDPDEDLLDLFEAVLEEVTSS